jgi:hypothetical protein
MYRVRFSSEGVNGYKLSILLDGVIASLTREWIGAYTSACHLYQAHTCDLANLLIDNFEQATTCFANPREIMNMACFLDV